METDCSVLVVGAGPVGLITALQLAKHGVKTLLIERNNETTRWPKMDITNVRSMELLERLGLDNALRDVGVPGNYSFDVLFSTGLGEKGELITKWDLPSPDEWRKKILENNDGSMPRQPYQRCSQALFEAWLKPICEANPLIECHFGLKAESVEEDDEGVVGSFIDMTTKEKRSFRTKYAVACDGAGSRLRKSVDIPLTGGPVPMAMLLVHFKSRDLTRLQAQGQFWHIFFTTGTAIISQDEIDTWTIHTPVPLDCDVDSADPYEYVYRGLGGSGDPYPIKIDKVLVKSSWRPNLAVADTYRSKGGRVFLAGDSAHQNIPTGGYGMNMGLGDAYDIGWKLAAVVNGWGGEGLLDSYTVERRPVALRNVERSGVFHAVHWHTADLAKELGESIQSKSEAAQQTKDKMRKHILENDGENKDQGVEMDYRFANSPAVVNDGQDDDHPWNPRNYFPSTQPGSRAPHVFLADGKTSIFDLYGPEYTIVDFTRSGEMSTHFVAVAEKLRLPLERQHLPDEHHVHKVWGRDVVLVRPDGFVSWRSVKESTNTITAEEVKAILSTAVGTAVIATNSKADVDDSEKGRKFTASGGNVDLDRPQDIALLGEFQK